VKGREEGKQTTEYKKDSTGVEGGVRVRKCVRGYRARASSDHVVRVWICSIGPRARHPSVAVVCDMPPPLSELRGSLVTALLRPPPLLSARCGPYSTPCLTLDARPPHRRPSPKTNLVDARSNSHSPTGNRCCDARRR